MRLRGRWVRRARRDTCTPPVPHLSDGAGSLWRCRHGGTYELTLNYRWGDRQVYRWDAASESGGSVS